MLQLYSGPFIEAYHRISGLGQVIQLQGFSHPLRMANSEFIKFREEVELFHSVSVELGLALCAASSERLINVIGRIDASNEIIAINTADLIPLKGAVDEITNRLKEELGARLLLIVPSQQAAIYEQKAPLFGPKVDGAFPLTAEDISEAGKCLALGRTTACVFHLMRAMEAAVLRLGTELNVTIIDRNNVELAWGPILSNINDAIRTMPKGVQQDRWSEAAALLYHVKQA